jgi:hypothetical protein
MFLEEVRNKNYKPLRLGVMAEIRTGYVQKKRFGLFDQRLCSVKARAQRLSHTVSVCRSKFV